MEKPWFSGKIHLSKQIKWVNSKFSLPPFLPSALVVWFVLSAWDWWLNAPLWFSREKPQSGHKSSLLLVGVELTGAPIS